MEPFTVTVPDAMKATGLSRPTIWRLIAANRLETVKIGRRTLVKTASIRTLVGVE